MSVQYGYCKTAIFTCDTPKCIDVNGENTWLFVFGKDNKELLQIVKDKDWHIGEDFNSFCSKCNPYIPYLDSPEKSERF